MVSYSALEEASSKNPHDWGRAMATAMTKLLDAARIDGRHFEHEFLYGEELRLRVDENNGGATVKLTWTPADQEPGSETADQEPGSEPADQEPEQKAANSE